MVDKFKKILTKLKEKGDIILFAVMRMDEQEDKWSVAISANWTEKDEKKVFQDVVNIFVECLDKEEQHKIARLGIFKKDENIAKIFLKYKLGTELHGEKVNGFFIHEGYILASENS